MARSTPERDWKYIRSVCDDLLATLCERINKQSADILAGSDDSEHKKYQKLYRHIENSDDIIGQCFDDLKRSNLLTKLAALQYHGILTPEYINHLSEETKEVLQALKQLSQRKEKKNPSA